MILRQETIDKLDYDPVRNPPAARQKVVWRYPCCGLVQVRQYNCTNDRCYTCFNNDRRGKPKEEAFNPIRTETKLLHGQLVQVKIYRTGCPIDYTPSFLEYDDAANGEGEAGINDQADGGGDGSVD